MPPTNNRLMEKLAGLIAPSCADMAKDMQEVASAYCNYKGYGPNTSPALVDSTRLSNELADLLVSINTVRELVDGTLKLIDEIYTEFPEVMPMGDDTLQDDTESAKEPDYQDDAVKEFIETGE
jgi:hypothetical protein